MQIFDRGINESLIINHSIEVKVLEVSGDTVRIAIITPDSRYREEVIGLDRTREFEPVLN